MFLKIEDYPYSVPCFTGIKSVIFKWSNQNLPDTPELRTIVNKFITLYFSDKLKIMSIHSARDDMF